jgi:hypothetical protein
MLRRLAKHAQRMTVGLLLAGRAGDRIAADAAIIERERIDLGEFVAGRALLGVLIAARLVRQPDLAPSPRPFIAIEARQRLDDLLGLVAANAFERIDPPGAAQDLRLDLVERPLARAGRCLDIHGTPPRTLFRLFLRAGAPTTAALTGCAAPP